ncbi:MAG: GAF domain-containing protein [Acidimicrobiales bacterium]
MTDVTTIVRDRDRVAALRRLVLLDTPPSPAFDRITEMAARVLRAPVALLTLVDVDRQWFKSSHGLAALAEPIATAGETPLSYSICQYAVAAGRPLIVHDAREDPQLCDHPTVRRLGVRSYAGVPLFSPDRYAVGTLCVLDVRLRRWSRDNVVNLADLAAVTMNEIALHVKTRRELHRHVWRGVPPGSQ